VCCGLTWISTGRLKIAKRVLRLRSYGAPSGTTNKHTSSDAGTQLRRGVRIRLARTPLRWWRPTPGSVQCRARKRGADCVFERVEDLVKHLEETPIARLAAIGRG
jgi:hypothetical protein